jgi:GT2 family glycosyltransferase
MELSVIVVSYNNRELLRHCLTSVAQRLAALEHEVCVVDNGSTDGTVAMVRQQFPAVRAVANETNIGFAAAVNRGLASTSGQFVLWLNPDAELLDAGLGDVLRFMRDHGDVGIVGPSILNTDGSIQYSCRSFPSYKTALFSSASILSRLFPNSRLTRQYVHSDWDHASVRDFDWVSGACLLHRRELGPLDGEFFMYCEDVDYCFRARQAGWRVVYHPGASVRHHVGGSTRKRPLRMIVEHHRSMWRYYRKHFPRHILKDMVISTAIAGRCALALLGGVPQLLTRS